LGNRRTCDKCKCGKCKNQIFHTGRSPFTVTRVPARVCGQ
jgi:hypothetical protein